MTYGRVRFAETGSHASHEARSGLRPAGFDPARGEPFKVPSLFAGIGGFDLGLERTGGFKTVAFCEIDPFCRRVLAKHWPGVPCYDDVRTLTAERLASDGIAVDCIVGGFPCQDLSTAGRGAGLEGERSGLWREFARLIGDIQPRFVIVENVAALLARGFGRVLGDLAALGFDAEWHCIPACAVGAPHRRDRVWVLAYPNGRNDAEGLDSGANRRAADASEGRDTGEGQAPHGQWLRAESGASGAPMADAERIGPQGRDDARFLPAMGESRDEPPGSGATRLGWNVADTKRGRLQGGHEQRAGPPAIVPPALGRHCGGREFGAPWRTEPDVGRVAYGLPSQVDRLKSLGNAVVPQIPELIGRAILEAGRA